MNRRHQSCKEPNHTGNLSGCGDIGDSEPRTMTTLIRTTASSLTDRGLDTLSTSSHRSSWDSRRQGLDQMIPFQRVTLGVMEPANPRVSPGQNGMDTGFLNRVSEVRFLPGAPEQAQKRR